VLKRGQSLTVVESEVFAEAQGRRSLVAKLNATMAVVNAQAARQPAAPG
jgi:acyl-coenzyme A thioesterase PaaI-like protein